MQMYLVIFPPFGISYIIPLYSGSSTDLGCQLFSFHSGSLVDSSSNNNFEVAP